MLACRPQGACQRIARAGRAFKIAGAQADTLGLQKDAVAAALDVERTTVCTAAALVGNDGICRRLCVASCAGLVERLAGAGEPLLEAAECLVVGHDRSASGSQRRRRAFQRGKLILQAAGALLDARQLHPRLGEFVGRPLPDSLQLLATPGKAVACQLQLLGERLLLLVELGGLVLPHRSAEEDQHDQQSPHRAQQHGKERKQRDRRPGNGGFAAHAAFPLRRAA